MSTELTPEYIASIRRMSGPDKLRAAMALYRSARQLKAAGLRAQHPEWTEEQVQAKVKDVFFHART